MLNFITNPVVIFFGSGLRACFGLLHHLLEKLPAASGQFCRKGLVMPILEVIRVVAVAFGHRYKSTLLTLDYKWASNLY